MDALIAAHFAAGPHEPEQAIAMRLLNDARERVDDTQARLTADRLALAGALHRAYLAGHTYEQLAAHIGVTRQWVAKLIQATHSP
jgi:predicted transcriptional regulator